MDGSLFFKGGSRRLNTLFECFQVETCKPETMAVGGYDHALDYAKLVKAKRIPLQNEATAVLPVEEAEPASTTTSTHSSGRRRVE